jgi:hypothetical protein
MSSRHGIYGFEISAERKDRQSGFVFIPYYVLYYGEKAMMKK